MQVTDAMVAAAAESDAAFDGRTWLAMPKSERERYMERSRRSLTAAMAELWRPVGEAEPNRTYLLGWHDWRDHAWCTEVAPAIHGQRFANGYSNVSRHGSATHFMHLPAPPKTGGE